VERPNQNRPPEPNRPAEGRTSSGPLVRGPEPLLRALWLVLLVSLGALAWFWSRAAPRGFPTDHPKFWANEVLPLALFVPCAVGAFAALVDRRHLLLLFAAGVGPLWLAAAVAGRLLFPVSLSSLFLLPLALGALAAVAWFAARSGASRFAWPWAVASFLAAAAGAALGILFALAQRAPLPGTRPLSDPMPSIPVTPQPPPSVAVRGARLDLWHASLSLPCGGRELEIEPLLRFYGRSPDRFWVRGPRQRPDLVPVAVRPRGEAWEIKYSGTIERFLSIAPEGRGFSIEGWARLEAPFYSHLNAFATLRLRGAKHPALLFSPTPARPIDVLFAEYPRGAPQRQAWLEPTGTFRVTQASDADKGPFRTLAEGPLARDAPLSITLLDAQTPLCRVTLEDWPRQLSVDLSPTAGWGAPVNAVEFSLVQGDVMVILTLAGTSVGRGIDSIGHTAGVYRNRLRVEPLPLP
jgi:hypothetical protein